MELWRLPNQRKISLRFLASYLLKLDIQVVLRITYDCILLINLIFSAFPRMKFTTPSKTHGRRWSCTDITSRSLPKGKIACKVERFALNNLKIYFVTIPMKL